MMSKNFGQGFGAHPNWAQMPPAGAPSQGVPTPVGQPVPAPAPQANPVIGGVADYNSAPWAHPGGTPAALPTLPSTSTQRPPTGLLAAIMRALGVG